MSMPSVAAVVPARNEVGTIAETVRCLLDQDYPISIPIIVVDDNSEDGTADAAREVTVTDAEKARLTVVSGEPLADGWTGKMWAVRQGINAAPASDYLLLTDADIHHEPSLVSNLIAKAEGEGIRLVSLMVKLKCQSPWECLLIPAFVYYFQKLYPFSWVNDPAREEAAAAGGCMLVHRQTLEDTGGIEAIHDKVIDDCAMAALIKPHGPIWLGLAEETESTRSYAALGEIWRMVSRTAYLQLRHSPLLLLAAVAGMALLYVVPPLALMAGLLNGGLVLAFLGGAGWAVMTWTYLPTVELYRLSPLWALLLPVAGLLFTLVTIDSARRHYMRTSGQWKGRRYGV